MDIKIENHFEYYGIFGGFFFGVTIVKKSRTEADSLAKLWFFLAKFVKKSYVLGRYFFQKNIAPKH